MNLRHASAIVAANRSERGNTPLYQKALTRLGVEARPVPPVYEPETVVDAILYAAEHPSRALVTGGAGKALGLLQRLSPRTADVIAQWAGFLGPRSQKPKPAGAPNNRFHHLEGFDTVKGEYSAEAKSFSLYTWLQTHPLVKRSWPPAPGFRAAQ